ncbi:hypothetical protein WN48_00828 [Eufriesea mexicana]|nr:hypothetical protein WN48_00828 [Eufriesea mexicana]
MAVNERIGEADMAVNERIEESNMAANERIGQRSMDAMWFVFESANSSWKPGNIELIITKPKVMEVRKYLHLLNHRSGFSGLTTSVFIARNSLTCPGATWVGERQWA